MEGCYEILAQTYVVLDTLQKNRLLVFDNMMEQFKDSDCVERQWFIAAILQFLGADVSKELAAELDPSIFDDEDTCEELGKSPDKFLKKLEKIKPFLALSNDADSAKTFKHVSRIIGRVIDAWEDDSQQFLELFEALGDYQDSSFHLLSGLYTAFAKLENLGFSAKGYQTNVDWVIRIPVNRNYLFSCIPPRVAVVGVHDGYLKLNIAGEEVELDALKCTISRS